MNSNCNIICSVSCRHFSQLSGGVSETLILPVVFSTITYFILLAAFKETVPPCTALPVGLKMQAGWLLYSDEKGWELTNLTPLLSG